MTIDFDNAVTTPSEVIMYANGGRSVGGIDLPDIWKRIAIGGLVSFGRASGFGAAVRVGVWQLTS